jgi:hypothetical protein
MNSSSETLQMYQALIVVPSAGAVLTVPKSNTFSLLRISVARHSRHARSVQDALFESWQLWALVLRFLSVQEQSDIVVCELLDVVTPNHLTLTPIETLFQQTGLHGIRNEIVSLLRTRSKPRVNDSHWIEEAIAWVESETGTKLASRRDIRQYNAGIGFALLRFTMTDGQRYWLKATGDPNKHEYAITVCLSKMSRDSQASDSLPELIAVRSDWNAWIMSGKGEAISDLPTDFVGARLLLRDAVTSLARLQIVTLSHAEDLRSCGAFDQRCERLVSFLSDLEEYLVEAMAQQTSNRVPALPRVRIHELVEATRHACDRMLRLDLPITILHGDLNRSNLLRYRGCQFIDWSEGWIGPPLLSFEHLLLLNRIEHTKDRNDLNVELRLLFCSLWSSDCDPVVMRSAMPLAELLAPVATLHGRGDWMHSNLRTMPERQAYSRAVARHLDRTLARQHESGKADL